MANRNRDKLRLLLAALGSTSEIVSRCSNNMAGRIEAIATIGKTLIGLKLS